MDRREYSSILVIRRDNIGDLVCTTPLLTALRKQYPRAWIGVLANSYNAAVLNGNPDVDAIYAYRKLKHLGPGNGAISALADKVGLMWKLRRRKLDLVVLAAGAQDVHGAQLAKMLVPRRTLLSHAAENDEHEVARTFSAARTLGIEGPIPPLLVSPDKIVVDQVRRAIAHAGLTSTHPLVGLHISARRVAQRWPAERFAELAIGLHAQHGAATMLFWAPGPGDRPEHPGDDDKASTILRLAAGRAPVIPWPTAELTGLVAGLATCDAVICSDGGAMHIAAALGKPLLCFFGDSPVDRWRPWGVRHSVLQASSRKVEDISLDEVLGATSLLLRS
jgi:ADP-heptose:LPS heptosyltransferase